MKRDFATILLFVLLGSVRVLATPLDFSFDLIPAGGAILGPADSTIGCGYKITNLDGWHSSEAKEST